MKQLIIFLLFFIGCTNQKQSIDIFYTPKNPAGEQLILILDVDENLLADGFKSRLNGKEWTFLVCNTK